MAKSIWFKRFEKDLKRMSPYLRLVRIKHGFYRIYIKQAYLHEVYEEMPYTGFDITEENPNLLHQKYFEEREDKIDMIRKMKNYKEGYWDSIDRITKRFYLYKNNKEFRDTSDKSYQTMFVR